MDKLHIKPVRVAKPYNVSVAEITAAFDLRADVSPDKAIKDLESDKLSATNLRTWLKEKQTQ